MLYHPDDHGSFWGLGWNPLLNFGTWERTGSMTSLWFLNGCWGNSTDNNACVFVLTYLLPSHDDNLRPLSNPMLAVCALFWPGLALSPVLDKHCFENQNSSSGCAPLWIYSMAPVFFRLRERKKAKQASKKKPDKNGLSVQLAIAFPAGLYFRHLCKGMWSHTLGTGISPPPPAPQRCSLQYGTRNTNSTLIIRFSAWLHKPTEGEM